MAAMPLPLMVGVHGDLVHERTPGSFGADKDADRVRTRERDHAAAAPDLQVADRPLEEGRRHRRFAGEVWRPAAIQPLDQQPDVVGAAEAVCSHVFPGGFAPPDPPAPSLAGAPRPRSAPAGRARGTRPVGGFAPPDPPAPSLAGAPRPRSAPAGRARGPRPVGGFAPPDPPAPSLAGAPRPRSAPAGRARGTRPVGGFAPPDPPAPSLAGAPR